MEQLLLFHEGKAGNDTAAAGKSAADIVMENASLGVKFFYDIYETADLLETSYKRVSELVLSFKIDCLKIRTTYRIPWWSLINFINDSERISDIEEKYYQWIRVQENAHLYQVYQGRRDA